jgi:hypothetical protein
LTNYTQLLSKIAAKTTLGFANLIFLLAIALFAPAWTLRFWQALLYLLLFASSSATITVYLWNRDQALLSRRQRWRHRGKNPAPSRSSSFSPLLGSRPSWSCHRSITAFRGLTFRFGSSSQAISLLFWASTSSSRYFVSIPSPAQLSKLTNSKLSS